MVLFSKFISYLVFFYHSGIGKITLITEPAIAYMLLHKILFIDAI